MSRHLHIVNTTDGSMFCEACGKSGTALVGTLCKPLEEVYHSPVNPKGNPDLKEADPDNVHLPEHYNRFPVEPVYFIGENDLNFFQANIIKYIMRYDAKNGLEDIAKAKRYLDMWEKKLKGDPNWSR